MNYDKEDSKQNKKIIETALKRFDDAEEGWSENRQNALEDIRFARMGEQWPENVAESREREGRPCLTINRLPAFIRQVVNDARLNSPSIKVHPVDDYSDPETAEVINGLIRNIEKTSNADVAYDHALECAVTNGFGFFRIDVDYSMDDAFDLDIKIERIPNPLSVYIDPHSMATDATDWNYCFVVDNMPKSEFKASYPNADCNDFKGGDSNGWVTEDTVRVCEYWTREEVDTEILMLSDGTIVNFEQYKKEPSLQTLEIINSRQSKTYKVMQYLMTSTEIIETTEWAGRYIPIVPVYGDEVIVEDQRHFISLTRPAKDAQRNYNYWRTASTEKVALATKAPWIGPSGAFDSDDNWKTANTETHPYLEYDGNIPPQQTPPSMADAGSITEALNASDDLKNIMGIQDASLGMKSNETSGKAIMARQREGDVSTFHFIDNLSRGIGYAGKVILDLIPHVYNTPRIMRILGYDGTPETVQINKEFDVNGMVRLHDLTKGKYDLVVDTGPSFTSKRDEAATQMTEMLRSFPQAAPIIGDLVAKNLDWPGADEIAKRLKTLLPPQIQAMEKLDGLPPEAQAAVAQAQQQIQQMSQLIEQGKQMLMEKDEQIKGLELEKKSKQDELSIRELDSQRRFQADMSKIEADKQMKQYEETEKQRRFIIEEAIDALKQQVTQDVQQVSDSSSQVFSEVQEELQNYQQIIKQLAMQIDELSNKNKVISIQAPSGATYEGVVENGAIEITAPSGQVYTGQIEEQ